jgi:JmjC domain, hydroxylase/Jumonji helical domain
MSAAGSYTDFHIDFGGSSVFYHILHGKFFFLFIEPTEENLEMYEAWCRDPDHLTKFFGDNRKCVKVELKAGETMFIPSGWIHAVYTPEDSLVIGGNFLTPLHLGTQLLVAGMEDRMSLENRFRFPSFDIAMWYTAVFYLNEAQRTPIEGDTMSVMSSYELEGLKQLAKWLCEKAKDAKGKVPSGVDTLDIAPRFAEWVFKGEEKTLGWYRDVLGVPRKRKQKEDPCSRKNVRKSSLQ